MTRSVNDYLLNVSSIRKSFDAAAKEYDQFAVLQHTVTDRLIESFEHIRTQPEMILDLGAGTGYGSKKLRKEFKKARIIQVDLSDAMLKKSKTKTYRFFSRDHFLCADASKIPLPDLSVDLVFSSLMMQWCNDLDAVFSEIRRVLKPGGLFIFTTFGPDSLKELRESWRVVDDTVHVNVFIDMHDIGDSLMRHNLGSPVLNIEHLVFTYDSCRDLMLDLKNVGAHNINSGRRKTLTGKNKLNKMIDYYERYRDNNKLPATYEIIYGHAWRVDEIKDRSTHSISLNELKQELNNRKEF